MSHRKSLLTPLLSISIAMAVAVPSAADDVDLDLYAKLLESHTQSVGGIVGTRVDYRGVARSAEWKRLAAQVRQAKPSQGTRNEKLAFWINAYNILTIDLIAAHYPISGIKDLGSFFSPVWDLEVATIEGRKLSLGAIEHEILRKMKEPRIHAAIVCASVSCPPLARTPFRPDRLDADLTRAMGSFVANHEKGVAIDRASGVIRLSKIFDWFKEDFDAMGGVLSTIAPHLDAADAAWIRKEGPNASIRYFGYDWSLNDLK